MPKKYRVKLSSEERDQLQRLLKQGRVAGHKQRHARILLKADEDCTQGGLTDQAIADAIETSVRTVERTRRIFVEHGFERALERKDPDRSRLRSLDGKGEARLIALTCGEPPEGRARWTLRLLADQLVELEVVPAISHETVRTTLKKTNSNPG
jgi:hypothetical protein